MSKQKQEDFEKELQRVAEFFEGNSKTDNCYFRLYTSKYPNSKLDQKNLKASNFESTDLDESLEVLKRELLLHGKYSPKFWFVKLLSSSTDPNGVTITIKNVLSDELEKDNSFFSANQIGSVNNDSLIIFQQQMLEKHNDLEKQLISERHNRELEKMEERLESLENSSKTIVDSITGFAQSETGQLIVTGLIGLITSKISGAGQTPPIAAQQVRPTTPANNQSNNTDFDAGIVDSLNTMKNLFGDDFSNVLQGLANFCATNPAYAQQLVNNQKTTENGK